MLKYILITSLLFASLNADEIISQKELELLKCNKLSQCLEFATGISSINGEGDIFQTTTIRGNSVVNYNTNTLLLLNGMPILNSLNGSFNLDSIPLSSISKIEITKGGSSVVYGQNATNGAINIITKTDKDKGSVLTRYGSYETFLASTSLSYDLGEDLSLSLSVEQAKSSGEPLTIKDESGDSKEFFQNYRNNSLHTKLQYKELWFQAQLFERSLPNYKTSAFTIDTLDAKEENTESEYLLGLGYKHEINNDVFLKFQSVYHNWKLTKDRLEETSKWDYDSESFYNELEAHFFTNTTNVNILGVSYELANAHRYISENSTYDIGLNDEKTHKYSLYDNGNYMINNELDFLYGARFSYSSYYDNTLSKDIENDNLSVKAGLVYKASSDLSLKALYSQSYREATYYEREVASTIIGDPELTPELSQTFDLILAHKKESFNYSLGVFYTQTQDKIYRIDLNATTKKYENIDDIDYYGLEFNTKFKFSNTFWGFANYSYTDSDSKTNTDLTKFTYNHMFNLAVSKLFSEQYLINTSIKHLDSWGEAKSYTLVNFSFDYNPKTMKSITYEIVMKNVLDEKIDLPEMARDNQNVTTIPSMYESRIYLGLKYDF